MHELSVVGEVIRIVSEQVRMHEGTGVEEVHLVIGELTGHRVEMLQYCFDILAEGTPLEGARLSARYVRPVAECTACGLAFEKEGFPLICPACGEAGRLTEKGRELYIDAIVTSEAEPKTKLESA